MTPAVDDALDRPPKAEGRVARDVFVVAASTLTLALACGPGKSVTIGATASTGLTSTTTADTEGSVGEATSDASSDATSAASTTEATGPATSTETTETGDTSADACPSEPIEGLDCEPIGPSVGRFSVGLEYPWQYPPSASCTVTAISDDGALVQTLTLDCDAWGPFDLEVHTASPHIPIPVAEGALVTYQHTWNRVCMSSMVALRDQDDVLLFGGVNVALGTISGIDFSPLQFSITGSDCPGILEPCERGALVKQRGALRFSRGGFGNTPVFPGNSITIGIDTPYTINASRAEWLVCSTPGCHFGSCPPFVAEAVWVLGIGG